jgi:non-heme chloroperoxidase
VKDGTTIYYKDWGKGPVVTFSHGWPLSSDAWDGQLLSLHPEWFRVVCARIGGFECLGRK